ncbi:MAG: hypothetical protein QME58_08510 [Bacteroidota bacterium]|nr:hypothetical protein [Bacteroidota bacterium]
MKHKPLEIFVVSRSSTCRHTSCYGEHAEVRLSWAHADPIAFHIPRLHYYVFLIYATPYGQTESPSYRTQYKQGWSFVSQLSVVIGEFVIRVYRSVE